MLRTAGYVFTIIVIGSVAIAWSRSNGTRTPAPPTVGHIETLLPLETQLKVDTQALPVQQFDDRSFVFTDIE